MNLTKIHEPNIMAIMELLFPDGFDKLLDARRQSVLEMKEVTYKDNPKLKVLGGTVKIEVTFKPEGRDV